MPGCWRLQLHTASLTQILPSVTYGVHEAWLTGRWGGWGRGGDEGRVRRLFAPNPNRRPPPLPTPPSHQNCPSTSLTHMCHRYHRASWRCGQSRPHPTPPCKAGSGAVWQVTGQRAQCAELMLPAKTAREFCRCIPCLIDINVLELKILMGSLPAAPAILDDPVVVVFYGHVVAHHLHSRCKRRGVRLLRH